MVKIFGKDYKSFTTVLRALGLPYISPAYVLKRYGSFDEYLKLRLDHDEFNEDELHKKIDEAMATGQNIGARNIEVVSAIRQALQAWETQPEFEALDDEVKGALQKILKAPNLQKALRPYLKYSDD